MIPSADHKTALMPHFRALADMPTEQIVWSTFFDREAPVELDIGCGRGMFLFNASMRHPERNFLGLELDFKEGRRGARRLHKASSTNGRVIGGDAKQCMAKYITPHSVSAAHVYFPDPWWKRKHRRRRLFDDQFADLLAVVLQPGGLLHSWTDVEEYFEVIRALMNHHPLFEALPPPAERTAEHDLDYQTSFERRKRQDGLPIYRGLWQRKPLASAE